MYKKYLTDAMLVSELWKNFAATIDEKLLADSEKWIYEKM